MRRSPFACLLAILALSVSSYGQLTEIPAGNLISPQVLDFEAFPTGPVSGTDPLFIAFNLTSANKIGTHTTGDTLSSGYNGNALVSQGNQLAIAAPNDPMDNQSAGAGFGFVLASGTTATQFGFNCVDQLNHTLSLETYYGGAPVDSITYTFTGSFGILHYFEGTGPFDEIRFIAPTGAGGWGVDDLTFGNLSIGGGSVTTIPAACGAANLGYSGLPNIGNPISFTITNPGGASMIWLGIQLPGNVPICPGCDLIATPQIIFTGASLNANIPNTAVIVGATLCVQGADIGPGLGGCNLGGVDVTVTDALSVTFGT